MDKKSRVRGRKLDEPAALLDRLKDGSLPFDSFEKHFLNYITSDIEAASKLAKGLKRRLFPLRPLEQARKFRLIARYYEVTSQHKLTIKWCTRALEMFDSQGERDGSQKCRRLLFSANMYLGRYERARQFAYQALDEPGLNLAEQVKIHANLGVLCSRIHDYSLALDHYTIGLQLLGKETDEKTRAILLYNQGVVYVSLNKFVEAEQNFAEASDLFRHFEQRLLHAHVLQSFGYLYTILGQYFRAEEMLKQARELYKEGSDSTGLILCDVELIRLDTRLNRYDRILARMPRLLEEFHKKGLTAELGILFFNGVMPAMALREYDLAEAYLHQASRIFGREKNQHYRALCTMTRGVLLWRQRQGPRGLKHINKARQFFAEASLHELELESLIYADRVNNKKRDPETFRRVRHLLKQPLSPNARVQGLILLNYYWYDRGQIKRSITSLFEAINIIEESRATIQSRNMRASFFGDKTEIYELLLERLLQWRDPSAANQIFRVMELSRSRQMMELLSRREALPPVINQDEPLLMELHRLDLRIKQLNRKLEGLAERTETTDVEKGQLLNAIGDTRSEIIKLRRAMRHEDRLSLFYPVEFRPDEIRKVMDPNSLLVIYFLGAKTLYRIELDHDSLKTYQHPLPNNFRRDFGLMINILSNRITPRMKRALEIAEEMSKILVPQKTKNNRHITFILHKDLQRFPLAMLRRNGRYLLETHTISQAPNLAVYYFTQKEPAPRFNRPIFYFSDAPDDPTAPEREILHKCFPGAETFATLDRTEMEAAMSRGDFVHFAGHCVFNKRYPDESYLQLGGTRISLTAYARFRLTNHPFLNLAACQSGWMALGAGNEPHGFVIGSFAAGATALLAGLWEIDDMATGTWMNVFYGALSKGLSGAYREACLALIEADHDPYQWAGFSLLGRA